MTTINLSPVKCGAHGCCPLLFLFWALSRWRPRGQKRTPKQVKNERHKWTPLNRSKTNATLLSHACVTCTCMHFCYGSPIAVPATQNDVPKPQMLPLARRRAFTTPLPRWLSSDISCILKSCHNLNDNWWECTHTVDGSQIRRSPVEVGSLSHYLQGFIHPKWCRMSSINSIMIR